MALSTSYITGGKTGYTEKAKRTLVSTASKNNMDFIVVTLKDSDDWNTHKSLYQYAFENYAAYRVLKKNRFQIIGEKNYSKKGRLYIKKDIYIPLKKEELGTLMAKITLKEQKKLKNNSKVGEYSIYLNNQFLYKTNIYFQKKKTNVGTLRKSGF